MNLKCLVCGEELFIIEDTCCSKIFHGQVTHCNETIRFIYKDGKLHTSPHTEEAYNPLRIWSDIALPIKDKERQLVLLLRRLEAMEQDARMFSRMRSSTRDLLTQVRKTMLDPAVADSLAKPKSMFETLTVRWGDKAGVNQMWKAMLTMWANSNTELTAKEIEHELRTLNTAVKFARSHDLDIPPQLECVK
tara:strand:+ start:96 stop:668 length:573 start_codon:yes stop_codon:yes gene_type:complete